MGTDFEAVITVDEFFGLTIKMLLGVGLVFEMPTLIFFLARMGIVTSKWMVKNFKYAVLVIFVIAAVITPSPDMVNQMHPGRAHAGPLRHQHPRGLLLRARNEERPARNGGRPAG